MRYAILLLAMLFLFSCVIDRVPKDVLDKEKMERVLTDMLMAESFTENYLLIDSAKTREAWFTDELNKVLDINDVSRDQFMRSLDYYKQRPDQFKVIVDSMFNRSQRNREKIFDINNKKRINYE
jgi:hypothetical protein